MSLFSKLSGNFSSTTAMHSSQRQPLGIDTHLVLNALNHISLETYQLSGKEMPLVEILSDYIKEEHAFRSVLEACEDALSIGEEWRRVKAILAVKAALMDVTIQINETGDMKRPASGCLAPLVMGIFDGWSGSYGHTLVFSLHVDETRAVVTGEVVGKHLRNKIQPQPFANELVKRIFAGDGKTLAACNWDPLYDDENHWAFSKLL